MRLTEEQKEIIKSTAPILKEHGKEITSIFYKHMFQAHPELLNIFNQTNQKIGVQPLALANTVYFAAENIDNLDILIPQIEHIAHKHRALAILPEHYPIVGKYLLLGIDEFLGGMGDPNILKAWSVAYDIIASIFINREKQLYNELGPDERDKGFVPFTIIKKEKIANAPPVVSLTLERPDGGKMYSYQPGQYLTLRIKKGNYFHNRHYSLIEPFDGKSYRIAIKQEIEREPKGLVSNDIINNYKEGDKIFGTFPAGTFHLTENAAHHLFIAGGIGITVFTGMIQQLDKQEKSDRATLIHYVIAESQAVFQEQMHSILSKDEYHLHIKGKSSLQDLIRNSLRSDTHVYICGSVAFINRVDSYITEMGHPSSQVHLEAFGPSLSLLKDAVKDHSSTRTL